MTGSLLRGRRVIAGDESALRLGVLAVCNTWSDARCGSEIRLSGGEIQRGVGSRVLRMGTSRGVRVVIISILSSSLYVSLPGLLGDISFVALKADTKDDILPSGTDASMTTPLWVVLAPFPCSSVTNVDMVVFGGTVFSRSTAFLAQDA